MDNVSVLKFKYDIIRKPKKHTINIFEYAASLEILENDVVYLEIADLCIIDFCYQLGCYDYNKDSFHIIPIDSEDKILSFYSVGSIVRIESMWSQGVFYVEKLQLKDEINKLIDSIENIIGKKIDFFIK